MTWFSFCIEEIVKAILNGGRQGELKEDKVMTNLDSIFKSRDIALPTKVHLVNARTL